jgi:hypothetical protein
VNKNIRIFLLFLLFIFLSSLEISKINIPILFQRRLSIEENGLYDCLGSALPEDATILFFSQPDGTLDFTRYSKEYTYAEYELVPRILVAYHGEPVRLDEYPWLIAFHLPADEIEAILRRYSFDIVIDCEQTAVLRRIP